MQYKASEVFYIMTQAAPQHRGRHTGTMAIPPLVSEDEALSLYPDARSIRHLAFPRRLPSFRVIVCWVVESF